MHFGVPAYSQHLDVKSRSWKQRSCGIVALKTVMDHYEPRRAVFRSFARLIKKGVRMHAYIRNVGWSHRGLARIAMSYGFRAKNYDWWGKTATRAFTHLRKHLTRGPVLASIHRDLKPNAHGHLVAVVGFERGVVYYQDPDSHTRRRISRRATLKKFLKGWKRRIVVVRP